MMSITPAHPKQERTIQTGLEAEIITRALSEFIMPEKYEAAQMT